MKAKPCPLVLSERANSPNKFLELSSPINSKLWVIRMNFPENSMNLGIVPG